MPEKGTKQKENIYEQMKAIESEKKLATRISKKGKNTLKKIVYYSLPLASLVIFFFIVLWGTIPSIKDILNIRNEIKSKEVEFDDLNNQVAALADLKKQEGTYQKDLQIIDKIVPTEKTQVAKFVGQIEDLALANNLIESAYTSGEQRKSLEELQLDIEKQSQSESAALITIPTSSRYSAVFTDIENFLNDLYKKDDFITVGSLDMTGSLGREFQASQQAKNGQEISVDTTIPADSWSMEVTFQKYQFSEGFSQYTLKNLVPINTKPDELTLQYIRDRFGD